MQENNEGEHDTTRCEHRSHEVKMHHQHERSRANHRYIRARRELHSQQGRGGHPPQGAGGAEHL